MSRIEKLNELRHAMLELEAREERGGPRVASKHPKLGMHIALTNGESAFLEFEGNLSRKDFDAPAPSPYRFRTSEEQVMDKKLTALQYFMEGLTVPELRDEFIAAVDKIARKVSQLSEAAHHVNSVDDEEPASEIAKADKLREKWKGNSLFDLVTSHYDNQMDSIRNAANRAERIVEELGGLDMPELQGARLERVIIPSYSQANELYHRAVFNERKATKAPKNG